jgi:hypothetical protein
MILFWMKKNFKMEITILDNFNRIKEMDMENIIIMIPIWHTKDIG